MSALGIAVMGSPAQAAVAKTTVTPSFYDGNADHMKAASIMKTSCLDDKYYMPLGYITQPGYMAVANLQSLVADGNEIGGHAATHPDLATLPAAEAARQVCNDGINLTNWGFRVTGFAYLFASLTAATDNSVKNCVCNSSRGLGDISTRFGYSGCALAETIPRADPYETNAPDQVDNTWKLADLKKTVAQAEAEGGWGNWPPTT